MVTKQRLTTILFFLTIVLMLIFQSHHFSLAAKHSKNGITVSTYANGWVTISTAYKGKYMWTAWSDFTASLSASGREEGDTEQGWKKQKAYLPLYGATNPADIDDTFELTVTKWWIFKRGDEEISHHYSDGQSSSRSRPEGAKAECSGSCGGVTPEAEEWPDD
jgi:hypothetical protein